ncbi:hypothetical protein VTJ83DRAFT_5874 [Remersonia thermophila]|uniref:Uncharacterized protein n=1 Tax=Remersonia thermophila TaxID=72144 RepID=A0ABR4DAA6_9PEZI
MASPTRSDSRRRDSSDRSVGARMPRLLRATVTTEPSITTSTASPNALATQPSRRASELLSRVAFVSGSPPDTTFRRTSMYDSVDRHHEDLSSSPVSQPESFDELHGHEYGARYFSFPSFDLYESSQQYDDEKSEPKP